MILQNSVIMALLVVEFSAGILLAAGEFAFGKAGANFVMEGIEW